MEKVKLEKPDKCFICHKMIVPDLEAVTFGTKKWDGHSFKFNCECNPSNLRVCIG